MECVIDGIPIYYKEIGEGKPVLCIHGYLVDHRLMSGCLEPVFKDTVGYRRIYIDLPSMGKSVGRDDIKTSDQLIELLIKFADIVMPNENFLLIGESYGGYASLGLTYKIKDRIDGLFFICPGVQADKEKRNPTPKNVIINEEISEDKQDETFRFFQRMGVVINETTWQRFQEDSTPGIKIADHTYLDHFKKNGFKLSYQEELYKMKYDKPATMLLGKQDDIIGYTDMLFYLNNFSRGTFLVLDSSGHNLQIEQPDVLNAHLIAFLRAVELNK